MRSLRRKSVLGRLAIEFGGLSEWEFDFAKGTGTLSAVVAPVFGTGHESGTWTKESLLQNVHEDDRGNVMQLFDSSCIEGTELKSDFRVLHSHQSASWTRLSGIVERERGVPVRAYGVVGEIPAGTRSAASSIEKLPIAQDSFSRLVAEMSHQLRTPLNAIIGFSDLLISGAVSAQTPKYKQFLTHICSAGRQLLQLVNDILDLSKIEAGTLELFSECIQISELLAEVLHSLPGELLNNTNIESVVDPELPGIWADPVRLKQVLVYYLTAAVGAVSPDGTVAIRAMPKEVSGIRLEIVPIFVPPSKRVQSAESVSLADDGKQHLLMRELCRKLIEAQGGSTRAQVSAEGHWKVEILLETHERVRTGSRISLAAMPLLLAIQDGG